MNVFKKSNSFKKRQKSTEIWFGWWNYALLPKKPTFSEYSWKLYGIFKKKKKKWHEEEIDCLRKKYFQIKVCRICVRYEQNAFNVNEAKWK